MGLTLGEPLARVLARAARLVPRGVSELADIPLDAVRQDPAPSAAVLQGLFFGRIGPPRSERRGIEARTLVVGHGRDPIHPFSDSGMLVSELPDAQLLRARSVFELRLAPGRLMPYLARFVDSCWEEGDDGRSRPPLRAVGGER